MEIEKFNFTDEEFLIVVNMICKQETPLGNAYVPVTQMDEDLNLGKLDSLGMILMFTWLSELFDIEDTAITSFADSEKITITDLKEFVNTHCNRVYSYAEAERYIQQCM